MGMTMDSQNQEVWIGVDVGTTGVRAIAYTAEGVSVSSSEAFYPLLTPHPDWANGLLINLRLQQAVYTMKEPCHGMMKFLYMRVSPRNICRLSYRRHTATL